jgi:hypothetical protein
MQSITPLYLIDDASKVLNLTSKNYGRETFHDLCTPPGYDENTDVIRGHPHSQILNTHNISSLTISNNQKKKKNVHCWEM